MRSYVCTGIACILLSSLSIVSSLEWDFKPANQTACLKVKWDVTKMDIIATSTTGEGAKHQIDATTGVVKDTSSCPVNSLSTLNVGFADDVSMSLTFIKLNNMVTMDGTLTFIPFKLFQKYENTTATLTMSGELKLSAADKSFTCSSLKLMFTKATNNNYSLDMEVTDTQIQAFNITDGSFSEGIPCEADTANSTTQAPPMTTAANVTEVPTTGPSNVTDGTTEKPSTEKPTTENPTSMVPTAPPSTGPTYFYPNNTDPCIIVAGNFDVKVTYTKMDNSTNTASVKVPEDAKINGSCPQDMKSEISMSWGTAGAMRMVRMAFTSVADKAEINTISLDLDLDDASFPDHKDADLKADFPVKIELSKSTGYYKCKAKVEVDFGTNMLTMSDVSIQAFNVNGSSFSGERQECAADLPVPVTTESPVTTPAPVTPPAGSPPTNNYYFPGKCIVLNAGLEFVIPYTMKDNKNSSVTVGIPANFTTTGTCGNVTQMLNVTFYDDWNMVMIFNGGESADQLADSDSFYLEELVLSYVLQPDIFKDALNSNTEMRANNTFDATQFSAKKSGSYECNSNQNLALNKGVSVNTDNLRVKAFSSDNSTSFPSGDLSECPQDSDTNSVVPIAVGAALAGLVIIVLIAYLIGRRRSRSGYQQV